MEDTTVVTGHPPGCAGYLVRAPAPNRSGCRTFFTSPVDFEPPWWRKRQQLDIRVTPLTAEEYAQPLLDIIAAPGADQIASTARRMSRHDSTRDPDSRQATPPIVMLRPSDITGAVGVGDGPGLFEMNLGAAPPLG